MNVAERSTNLCLYNTLSRRVEPFRPIDPDRVGIYGCGPTLYGPAHIGNFRTFLFYDLLHRYLSWKGFRVHFVMNLTDVDDKTIRAARAAGLSLREYTAPYLEAVMDEAELLGVRPFSAYPRATEYIEPMIELVQRLLERGLAYSTPDGSVFFDISEFPDYGRLSGRDLDEARQSERVVEDDYGKDDARDFAVWKGAKEEDEAVGAAWDAPWGRGRPGWHLECSVMALSEVGETLDLHLGGEDLIFPHHEDEIAQSEGVTSRTFARCWVHAKHLRVDGRKMSKSLGNILTVRDLLEEGISPATVRHQLLSAQYRTELNFTREGLEASAKAIQRLLALDDRLRSHPVAQDAPGTDLPDICAQATETFQSAMDEDLNVSSAIAALFGFLNKVNSALDAAPRVLQSERAEAVAVLDSLDQVLGFLEVGRRSREVDSELREWVEGRIEARARARADRNWAAADAIREELANRGITLEDGPAGTRWTSDSASVDTPRAQG